MWLDFSLNCEGKELCTLNFWDQNSLFANRWRNQEFACGAVVDQAFQCMGFQTKIFLWWIIIYKRRRGQVLAVAGNTEVKAHSVP